MDPDAVYLVRGVGRGMGVFDWAGDRRGGRGSFGSESRVYHCNQWGLCCIMRELIELSFGVVSGVGLGIRVLDGRPCALRRTRVSGVIAPIGFNSIFVNRNVFAHV